jgi:hypothetical protein
VIKPTVIFGARHVARIGEKRNTQRILVREPEGERPHERSRRRWEDNIILHLKETEWKNLIGLFGSTQKKLRAFVNATINL